jgi:two-component system, chemotaxis family, protein-glutamate methylesterase/glutaminase
MSKRDIVVIGTSTGGLAALNAVVQSLPAELPAALFVVQHLHRESGSLLPEILSRHGPLPAVHPRDGQTFEHGHIYVAPPDRHLLLKESGKITLSQGPRENLSRPAIDVLFRSAALTYGARTIGVILTGNLDDGVAGLSLIKMRGGLALVQDPAEAVAPSMPKAALAEVRDVDYVLPVTGIGELLAELVKQEISTEVAPGRNGEEGGEVVGDFMSGRANHDYARTLNVHEMIAGGDDGEVVDLSCPECGGSLRQVQQGTVDGYRCHTGHQFSQQTLLVAQGEAAEEALWHGVRSLKEKASLAYRLAERWQENGEMRHLEDEYRREAEQAEEYARVLQELLVQRVQQ